MSEVNLSGNQDIDGILWGYKWDVVNMTYSMPIGTAEYGYAAINGFQAMNAAQTTAIHRIMANYENVCGLNFTYTTAAGAHIRFAEATSVDSGPLDTLHTIPTAEGTPPDPIFDAVSWGDTWYNQTSYNSPSVGSFAYAAGFMHEVGHALGLKHGHASQVGHDGITFPALPADHDSYEYSVMTYRQYVGDPPGSGDNAPHHPTSLMMNDIAALQYMYGADYGYNNGSTTYTFSTTTGEMFINGVGQGAAIANYVLLTVWDGGGVDTYDLSNYTTNLNINLNPGGWINLGTQIANLGDGHFARGNIANSLLHGGSAASLIENANGGSGHDIIVGNSAVNLLNGNGGNDYITSNGNLDIAHGGANNDQLYFNGNQNQLFGDADNDWLGVNGNNNALAGGTGNESWIGASGNSNILDGQDGHDAVYANGTTNFLYGGSGNDWLGVSGNFNALVGQEGVDWMGATGNMNVLYGQADGDTLLSVGGNSLYGGDGGDWVGCSGNNNQLFGGANIDYIAATGGFNRLDGGADNDTLFAAAGAHDHATFAFLPYYGTDEAFNFVGAVGDRIDIRGWGIADYAALTPYLTDTAAGLKIAFDGVNQLTIHDVHALDPSWLIFV